MQHAKKSPQGMMRRHLRVITWCVLVSAGPTLTGCYGHFPLTKGIYSFNGSVGGDSMGGRVLETVVFWAFLIIPIYSISMLLDAIVFNLIEFWSGRPITFAQADDGQGTRAQLAPSEDGREARLRVERHGELILDQRFVRIADGEFEVRDAEDRLVGRIFSDGQGKLRLTDAQSRTLRIIDAASLLSPELPTRLPEAGAALDAG